MKNATLQKNSSNALDSSTSPHQLRFRSTSGTSSTRLSQQIRKHSTLLRPNLTSPTDSYWK
uniref:Uncharacterized protein n=1 Tax=Brassica campestris TaxID=3711 RepID=A0A3P6D5J6_BRACM|nr:unnamed protein product [Brassica rapa]